MTQYKVGKVVKGNITGIENYGIFVNLEDYYSGLIHISEISDSFVKDVNDYAKIGDTIYARILEIDENNNHVKLSLKSVVKKRDENKKLNHIKETGSGFIKLEENLDRWIAEKLSEINK